jgi:hypothetical protein
LLAKLPSHRIEAARSPIRERWCTLDTESLFRALK